MRSNILIHSNYHPNNFGGVERVVSEIITIVNSLGWEASCFCGESKTAVDKKIGCVQILTAPVVLKIFGAPILKWGNLSLLKYGIEARSLIFQEPFPSLWPAVFVLNRILRRKVVVLIHADPKANRFISKVYSVLRLFVFKGARVIVTSPYTAIDFSTKAGVDFSVISLCLGDRSAKLTPVSGIRSRYCLYIGRLSSYKGIESLLGAMKLCPDISFVVAGDGPKSEVVRKFIVENSTPNLQFINRSVTDAEKEWLILNSSFIVFPSTSQNEAFGLVQLEAMRSGKAVINTKLDTGVNFVVPHMVCGITVPPNEPRLLADAIKMLWYNEDLSCRLGSNGLLRFEKEFSRKRFVESWERIITKLN